MSSKEIVSLLELNLLVREVIECEMPNEYWVEAELSECRESRGHCYMELVQKDEQTATPIAKALLNHKVGDIVEVKVPAGVQQLEVLEISL